MSAGYPRTPLPVDLFAASLGSTPNASATRRRKSLPAMFAGFSMTR
jgi:hypothetical protein